MTDLNNTDALRGWLRQCPALGGNRAFGVDALSDVPGSWALCSVTPAADRRNILGGRLARPAEYRLALRAASDEGARALELMRGVADWIEARGGPVRSDPAGALCRADGPTARWEMRIWVEDRQ